MIVDSLTHITEDGKWFHTDHDASLDRLLREMDAAKVDRSVVVALAGHIANKTVADACAAHSDRLIPGASFDPSAHHGPEEAAKAFDAELPGDTFQVLKLHPRLNQYDPLDPRMFSVLSLLAARPQPWPVWLDTLFYYPGARPQASVVDSIVHLASTFPNLQFVALHAGGTWMMPLCEAIRPFDNVTVDLSLTLVRYFRTSLSLDIRHLVETFDRRLVCGSDFPEHTPSAALQALEQLTPGIAPEKIARVAGDNLAELLNLKNS